MDVVQADIRTMHFEHILIEISLTFKKFAEIVLVITPAAAVDCIHKIVV
jgi:hypothetical protein